MPAGRLYVWRRSERQARLAVKCPDHPGQALCLVAGSAARGTCPVDGRSYQMEHGGTKAVTAS
jgi:hypothetical protein